jgi:putative ABC transport system permease protein
LISVISRELFENAFHSLRKQGLRSYLALLGIIIGIAAVVALVSVGQGLNMAVEKEFEKMGVATITVIPGGSLTETVVSKLRSGDAGVIEDVRGVEYATAIFMEVLPVVFKNETKNIIVVGIESEKQHQLSDMGMAELSEGRRLVGKEKSAIMIGSRLADGVFEEEIRLRQNLVIADEPFRVVGTIKPEGSGMSAFFNAAAVMDHEALNDITSKEITPFRIMAKVADRTKVEEVKDRIASALKDEHGKKDFMLMSQDQMKESATSILGIIQVVLIGIAAISLFVGGLGIMNTMFMAITERTKEIGIMKAIGATNTTVLAIFLTESSIIGLIGGIIGIALGFSLSLLIGLIAGYAGAPLEAYLGLEIVVGAMAFSFFIGLISGLLPSLRAARMQPVDALSDLA